MLICRLVQRGVVSSNWGFTQKYNTSELGKPVMRYKAQLVGLGFMKLERIDFFETYASVVKFHFVRPFALHHQSRVFICTKRALRQRF